MKLQAPDTMSSFSYQGVEIEIDKNGQVEVTNNPAMVQTMKDHGFTEMVTEPAKPASKARRAAE